MNRKIALIILMVVGAALIAALLDHNSPFAGLVGCGYGIVWGVTIGFIGAK